MLRYNIPISIYTNEFANTEVPYNHVFSYGNICWFLASEAITQKFINSFCKKNKQKNPQNFPTTEMHRKHCTVSKAKSC